MVLGGCRVGPCDNKNDPEPVALSSFKSLVVSNSGLLGAKLDSESLDPKCRSEYQSRGPCQGVLAKEHKSTMFPEAASLLRDPFSARLTRC